jgi:guanylate cyclase
VYLYGLALRKIFNASGVNPAFYRNGTLVSESSNSDFEGKDELLTHHSVLGLTGRVVIGFDGVRDSSYIFSEYDQKNVLIDYISFQVDGANANITNLINDTAVWASRLGFKPVSIPACGFNGKGCPAPIWQQYMALFICVIVIVIFIIMAAVSTFFYLIQ